MSTPGFQRKLLIKVFSASAGAALCLMAIVSASIKHIISGRVMGVSVLLVWISSFIGIVFILKNSRKSYAALTFDERQQVDAGVLAYLRKKQRRIKYRQIWLVIFYVAAILFTRDKRLVVAEFASLAFFGGYSIYYARTVKRRIAQLEASAAHSLNGETS